MPMRIGFEYLPAVSISSANGGSRLLPRPTLPGLMRSFESACAHAGCAFSSLWPLKWKSPTKGVLMPMASSRSRMCGTAAAGSSLLTVIRTSSDPARASALTCATVPSISAVSVLVMDCTTIGDLPPMVTVPTFTPREILREIIPQLYQGDALGHADHHGPGDFVVPGLTVRVEGDPEKSEADHHHGQEAAERPHDGGLPVDHASIQAHDAQIEHDAADGGAAHFPHHCAVRGQHQQLKVVLMTEHAHEKANQER